MSEGRVMGLLGPTGVGKTAVAVTVARLLGCRIISCDSMQVYAGFPVLTNQPRDAAEKPELHDMVGFLDPGETISAAEYAEAVQPLIESSVADCGWALIAGGSGLYMRAALAPLAAAGPADPELRRELEQRAEVEGGGALHEELTGLDPEAAASIDPRNVRRVMRALEAVLASGRRWSGRDDLWRPQYRRPTVVVGLSLDRAELGERITARTESMLKGGAVDEVAAFRAAHGEERTRPGAAGICSAIGYREIAALLAGESTVEETWSLMAASTRRYARRQETWLRRVRDAVMIGVQGRDAAATAEEIVDVARRGSQ